MAKLEWEAIRMRRKNKGKFIVLFHEELRDQKWKSNWKILKDMLVVNDKHMKKSEKFLKGGYLLVGKS